MILTICPERTKRVPVLKTQTQLDITSPLKEVRFLLEILGNPKISELRN